MNDTTTLSPLIRWCGRLALACLALIPLSVLSVKFGLVHFSAGLAGFAISCVLSLLVLLILAVVSLLPKFKEQRRAALVRSLAALPGVILAGALLGSGGDYPPIHDITTDTADPPVFVLGIIERGSDSNSLDIKPDYIAEQLKAFPDLATIESELNMAEAMDRGATVAEGLNWKIYNRDMEAGIIEASYTSFWFGFVDDVVIRFSPSAAGTEIDLRSVSRVGQGDLGANANRIRAFSQAFQSDG
jgi:uncharacterized protein (DUF1499 family)